MGAIRVSITIRKISYFQLEVRKNVPTLDPKC